MAASRSAARARASFSAPSAENANAASRVRLSQLAPQLPEECALPKLLRETDMGTVPAAERDYLSWSSGCRRVQQQTPRASLETVFDDALKSRSRSLIARNVLDGIGIGIGLRHVTPSDRAPKLADDRPQPPRRPRRRRGEGKLRNLVVIPARRQLYLPGHIWTSTLRAKGRSGTTSITAPRRLLAWSALQALRP